MRRVPSPFVFACISVFAVAVPAAAGWQTPGPIQQPKGPWLKPGDIQVPKGIQAVKSESAQCATKISIVADALFDFNKSTLRSDAEETLAAAGPEIAKAGKHKITVEGHIDSIGGDAYNITLSEARARTVRDWLVAHNVIPADSGIKGYGKTEPVAPNMTPDGKDDPAGRQKNRRVEIAVNTCSSRLQSTRPDSREPRSWYANSPLTSVRGLSLWTVLIKTDIRFATSH